MPKAKKVDAVAEAVAEPAAESVEPDPAPPPEVLTLEHRVAALEQRVNAGHGSVKAPATVSGKQGK